MNSVTCFQISLIQDSFVYNNSTARVGSSLDTICKHKQDSGCFFLGDFKCEKVRRNKAVLVVRTSVFCVYTEAN